MKTYRTLKRGFTLVEILIVVIILGILAAIVIPQFTNASQDARKNSLTSQLQTIRSQIELYKLQHRDQLPDLAGADGWKQLTDKTNEKGTFVATDGELKFGPYLQAPPINSISADPTTAMNVADGDGSLGTGPGPGYGWMYDYSGGTGKFWAASKLGAKIYNEGDPNASDNDL
jgi:general secretion pathway protein G